MGTEIAFGRHVEDADAAPILDEGFEIDRFLSRCGAAKQQIGPLQGFADPTFHRQFEMTRIGVGRIEPGTIEQKDLERSIGTIDLERFGQNVTGGSSTVGDDRALTSEQCIEEA